MITHYSEKKLLQAVDLSQEPIKFAPLNTKLLSVCEIERTRESEAIVTRTVKDVAYVKWCPDSVQVLKGDGTIIFESTELALQSGTILATFTNPTYGEISFLMEDLSLHAIQNGQ